MYRFIINKMKVYCISVVFKVPKRAKIRNRYNQVPHLTQDTNRKVTISQLDITNKKPRDQPFPSR